MSQIDKIIKKAENKLESVYLLYSSEKYLLDNFRKKFKEELIPEEIRDFNLSYLDDDDSDFIKKLLSKSKTLPTFAEKRFVIVNCNNYFTKKSSEDEKIISLFNNFPETTVLILLIDGKIDRRIKLNKTTAKAGEVIELNPPKYKNLDKWIEDRFNEYQKKIDRKGINLLEKMFDNNLQLLENEIEKIVTCYIEKDHINLADVKEVISRDKMMKENIIFSLTDALSNRDRAVTINILNDMVRNGESPLMILSMISRQLRLLIQVKELKEKGYRHKKIASILKEHPYPVKKCYRQSDNFSSKELELFLERFLEANLDIITGKYKDKKTALEMAMLNI